jgi:pimeloyl-ACP methyl ester carboxylesterase
MNISKLTVLWISTWPLLSRIFPKLTARWAFGLFLKPDKIPRPPSEDAYFNSAKKYKIQNRIAAFEWGQSHHPLVVLVHGWSGRGTQMAAFAEPLVQKGFRVVALDGPAHGQSQGIITHVGEYSQFLIDVQSELGPYRAVIAHSFGAGCSVLSASHGLKVEKLVLMAGPSRYELVVKFYLDRIKLSARSREHFIQNLADLVKLPVTEMNVGLIGKTLPTPALVVHDTDDKEVSYKAAEEIKSNWPAVELLRTSGLGHRRVLRDPAIVASVVDFITKD